MKYALVLLLTVPAQIQTDAGKERERITALEKRVMELEQTAVRGEDMWIEISPGRFVCRIQGHGCSEHWRAPISSKR